MAERVRFRIGDLLMLVAFSGAAFGGAAFIEAARLEKYVGEAAFWLVLLGFAVVLYLVYRFVASRENRLILLGLGVAFAAAAASMYMSVYLNMTGVVGFTVVGLMTVAVVLVAGGVAQGLLTRWHDLKVLTPPADVSDPKAEPDRNSSP
jgi:drug/metabolite transporter (DMT)-like permease